MSLLPGPVAQPYIYTNHINDFHIADTAGNSLGTIAAIFMLTSFFTSEPLNGSFLVKLVTVSAAMYEIAHPFLGKPIDTWDIAATIITGIISYILFNLTPKQRSQFAATTEDESLLSKFFQELLAGNQILKGKANG